MKMRDKLALLAAALMLTLAMPNSGAAQKELTPEQAADIDAQNINDLVTAYRLVEFGQKNKAPEALITAGSLFRKLSTLEMTASAEKPEITTEDDASKDDLVDKVEPAPDYAAKANELFAQALLMGKDLNLKLAPLINEAKSRKVYRSPVNGPKRIVRAIGPQQKHVYHFKLQALYPTTFGFQSSMPMRVTAVRGSNDNLYGGGIGTIGSATWRPGGQPGEPVSVTIMVKNVTPTQAQYQFWLK